MWFSRLADIRVCCVDSTNDKFGLGTVLSSNEERIVIKFDDHGEKKFVTPMVMGQLKKSDRQPPAEKRASRSRKAKVVAVPAPVA